MELTAVLGKGLAVLFALVLSYILYRVAIGAYRQYSDGNGNGAPWRTRHFGIYERIPRTRDEVVDLDADLDLDQDEDEGYHDAESFEIERTVLQKPLPERPLPDKPLPPVPGGG